MHHVINPLCAKKRDEKAVGPVELEIKQRRSSRPSRKVLKASERE